MTTSLCSLSECYQGLSRQVADFDGVLSFTSCLATLSECTVIRGFTPGLQFSKADVKLCDISGINYTKSYGYLKVDPFL